MCRIAIVNKEYTEIKELFSFLERSCGGHGNGVAYFLNGKMIIDKGLEKNIDEIVGVLKSHNITSQIMFHTRLASVGSISEENCQPFRISDDVAFCHNGTWHDYQLYIPTLLLTKLIDVKKYNLYSDSRILATVLSRTSVDFLSTLKAGGVYAVLYKKYAKIYVKNSTTFEAVCHNRNWVYASSFHREYQQHYVFTDNAEVIAKQTGFEIVKGKVVEKQKYSKTIYYCYPFLCRYNK